MNPGGEPERDDTGLPPVDIEIPDDARELDRDVQAYRRELRAQQRGDRHGRLHRSLSKDGVVLPLLACCLILALITGTLLTVFSATSSNSSLTGGLPGSPPSASTRSGGPQAEMVPNQALPDATVALDGAAVSVQTLSRVVLVLVPTRCDCAATFKWLVEVASRADVPVFLIYTTPTTKTQVDSLYRGLVSQLRWRVTVAHETDNEMSGAELPTGIPAGQLAAILVGPNSGATWVSNMSPRDNPVPLVRVLTGK